MIRRSRSLPHPAAGAALLVCAALVHGAAPAPASGQIVNTLRGWDDPAPGWSGEVEGRLAVASGNSDYLELSAGGAIQLVASRHRVRALASHTLRRANGEDIAEAFLAHARHNYRLSPLASTLVFVQHQHNPFLRLQRRTLAGAGFRLDVVRAEGWDASLGASAMVETERLTDGADEASRTEGRGSFFVSVIGDVTDALRVDVSAFYQPLLEDLGDSRAYTAATGRVDVVGGLDLLVSFDLLHDSRPPAGVEETDIRLSTGLVLAF